MTCSSLQHCNSPYSCIPQCIEVPHQSTRNIFSDNGSFCSCRSFAMVRFWIDFSCCFVPSLFRSDGLIRCNSYSKNILMCRHFHSESINSIVQDIRFSCTHTPFSFSFLESQTSDLFEEAHPYCFIPQHFDRSVTRKHHPTRVVGGYQLLFVRWTELTSAKGGKQLASSSYWVPQGSKAGNRMRE